MKMTVASPTPFQTSTRATEKIARCGLVSQPGPSMPIGAEGVVDQALSRGSSTR